MKHTRYATPFVLVALCLASLSRSTTPAQAQGAFDMGMLTNTLSQGAVQLSEEKRMHKSSSKGTRGHSVRSSKGKRVASSSAPTPITFTPSKAVRQRTVANFLANLRKVEPQNAASIEKDFASKDIFGLLEKKLAVYGLKSNNVADTLAVYLVVAWEGARGRNDDPKKGQMQGVKSQMTRSLSRVPALANLSNEKKQELGDSLLLYALLMDSYVSGAKLQPTLMPKVKSAIAGGVRSKFGFDLTALKLTNQGLQN